MDLLSLSEIFNQRILRIPDHQRGYSWNKDQFSDFWEDLVQLNAEKTHYTGVITLEPVSSKQLANWERDQWFLKDFGYKPFYVVDGQQRLLTSMILVQAIIESISEGEKLNSQSPNEIRNRYILYKTDNEANGESKESFLFGYEKDDPSDEFLRTEIFVKNKNARYQPQTLYTYNLIDAKKFFKEKMEKMSKEEIAVVFRKLTQNLKYNLYNVTNEIDVFVTFETMNNRGKPLSSVELLKNRLIYLSTLLENEDKSKKLRNEINETWKIMYQYLGKNPKKLLDDDTFLRDHWIMYFKYDKKRGGYRDFLLKEKFTTQNFNPSYTKDKRISEWDISIYIKSLRESIKPWFHILNPCFLEASYDSDINRNLLECLNRLHFRAFRPLLLAVYAKNENQNDINRLLAAVERYIFVVFELANKRSDTGLSAFYTFAYELFEGRKKISEITNEISNLSDYHFSNPVNFWNHITEKYKFGDQNGFYGWSGLHYFLYEYEQYLCKSDEGSVRKIYWHEFIKYEKYKITIEHILPQNIENNYWKKYYGKFNDQKRSWLTHSLGNLLPLSKSKNSKLGNKSFKYKKDDGKEGGYHIGSAAENEVNKEKNWEAVNIYKRGMKLLKFLEERWRIELGDDEFKAKLLHLDFLPPLNKSENSTKQNSD